MKSVVGAMIGTTLGIAVAYAFAIAGNVGSGPWFLLFVPAGLILGWRAGAAWMPPERR